MPIGWIPACAGMTAGWGITVISDTYVSIAEKIAGEKHHLSHNPKDEIIDVLRDNFQLIS